MKKLKFHLSEIYKNYILELFGVGLGMSYGLGLIFFLKFTQTKEVLDYLVLVLRYSSVLAPVFGAGLGHTVVKVLANDNFSKPEKDSLISLSFCVVFFAGFTSIGGFYLSRELGVRLQYFESGAYQKILLSMFYSFGLAMMVVVESVSKARKKFLLYYKYQFFFVIAPTFVAAAVFNHAHILVYCFSAFPLLASIFYLTNHVKIRLPELNRRMIWISLSRLPVDVLYPLISVGIIGFIHLRFGSPLAANISIQMTIGAGSLLLTRPFSTVILVNLQNLNLDKVKVLFFLKACILISVALSILSLVLTSLVDKYTTFSFDLNTMLAVSVAAGLQGVFYLIRGLVDGYSDFSLLSGFTLVGCSFLLVFIGIAWFCEFGLLQTLLGLPLTLFIVAFSSFLSVLRKF